MLNRYQFVLRVLTAGLFLGVLGCGDTTPADDPIQAGGPDEGSQVPSLGTLSLDNAQEISRQATKSVIEALSLHQYVLAYEGLYPWSQILHVTCLEGEADFAHGVKSPVDDPQGNELFGSRFDFDSCMKSEDQIYQGTLGVYWNSESTAYVVELEHFAVSDANRITPRMSSGVFVLSVNEGSAFQSEISNLVREGGSEVPVIGFDAALVYQNDGLKKLQWGGQLALAEHGSFELRPGDGEASRSVISDGESLLYIDFGSMNSNIIDASLDLGADGALDALWPINLNDLREEGAGLIFLRDFAAGYN